MTDDSLMLVVEDDPLVSQTLRLILEDEGFVVETVENGELALARLRAGLRPGMILSDIRMPVMTGYELLRAVRQLPTCEDIPFIFLSAKSASKDVRTGMELGADDYICKPFEPQDVIASVRTRLQRSDRLRQVRDRPTQHLLRYLPHELGTPLSILIGYTDLMLDAAAAGEGLGPKETKEFASALRSSGERLVRLTQNFTQLLELETRVRELSSNRPSFKLIAGWRETLPEELKEMAARYGRADDLQVQLEIGTLRAPAEMLNHMVAQLVDNACKFSLPGTPIVISGRATGDHYRLTVADRGRGMAPEQIEQIAAFRQFEREHFEQQGLGLGLAICRLFAIYVDGRFLLENRPAPGGVEAGFLLHATP